MSQDGRRVDIISRLLNGVDISTSVDLFDQWQSAVRDTVQVRRLLGGDWDIKTNVEHQQMYCRGNELSHFIIAPQGKKLTDIPKLGNLQYATMREVGSVWRIDQLYAQADDLLKDVTLPDSFFVDGSLATINDDFSEVLRGKLDILSSQDYALFEVIQPGGSVIPVVMDYSRMVFLKSVDHADDIPKGLDRSFAESINTAITKIRENADWAISDVLSQRVISKFSKVGMACTPNT